MKKNKTLNLVLLLCFLISIAFSADKKSSQTITLKADYSANQKWTYSINYTSQGNFRQKSSNTSKSTQISANMKIEKKDSQKLEITLDSISIKSDIYKEDIQKDIIDKLKKAQYTLTLINGFPSIDTSIALPVSYMEWDLYRQLIKLLPTLPTKPVKEGFTWERTDILPINTSRGKISCEVYRRYTLSSISGDSVKIFWKFRYSGGKADSSALSEIPAFGTGNGTAVLDIKSGYILSAEMNFTTPVATIGDVSVVWHENAVIRLVNLR